MKIHVGVCAFKKKYYTGSIRCVEIQRTFYNIPQEKTIIKWRKEAPEDFIFNIKAFQGLTHNVKSPTWRRYSKKITNDIKEKAGDLRVNDLTLDWMRIYSNFAKILRSPVIVVQTPSSFRPTKENIERAYQFFKKFSDILENESPDTWIGWEPRGKWLETAELKDIIDNIDKLIHIVDPFFHEPVVIKEISYFRLHGKPYLNYKYKYTKEDLTVLLKKLEDVHSKTTYIMFNNVFMETNAKIFMELIGNQNEI